MKVSWVHRATIKEVLNYVNKKEDYLQQQKEKQEQDDRSYRGTVGHDGLAQLIIEG